MKIYTRHRCDRNHTTARAFVKCAVPRASIVGNGEYATIYWCEYPAAVLLSTDEDAAVDRLDDACDGRCVFRHEVIKIDLENQKRMQFV
ncbi:hypothetical protein ACTWP6_27360 [Mycobacterium sp. 4D054]|uniref:hypothetical protein n=1 Tax=Mycobacterium sp. 4D054 TaxID=3457440 RepID=UPI003FCF599C